MRIALLGKGKTGSKVIELCQQRGIALTVFDSKNIPTLEKLADIDVILSFLTGEVFTQYIELLSNAKKPVITGSTGFTWTPEYRKLVEISNSPWIHANNFSLGMNIVKKMILIASKADALFENPKFKIHEIHHTKKVDAPSGTANSWKDWLNHEAEMTYERTGDVVGTHELTIETEVEKIVLRHEAKDRKIFAQGALWACEQAKNLAPGLHEFSNIAMKALAED